MRWAAAARECDARCLRRVPPPAQCALAAGRNSQPPHVVRRAASVLQRRAVDDQQEPGNLLRQQPLAARAGPPAPCAAGRALSGRVRRTSPPVHRVHARRSADALLLQPDWNVQDVQDFLARCASKLGNRMQSYQQLVAENDIDGEVLEVLEDDDLKRLGIKSLGHRCVASRVRQRALFTPARKAIRDRALEIRDCGAAVQVIYLEGNQALQGAARLLKA